MMWSATRSPATDRFSSEYTNLTGQEDGWQDRMPILHLRELLSIVAHGDDDRGAADQVRQTAAPFRRR